MPFSWSSLVEVISMCARYRNESPCEFVERGGDVVRIKSMRQWLGVGTWQIWSATYLVWRWMAQRCPRRRGNSSTDWCRRRTLNRLLEWRDAELCSYIGCVENQSINPSMNVNLDLNLTRREPTPFPLLPRAMNETLPFRRSDMFMQRKLARVLDYFHNVFSLYLATTNS